MTERDLILAALREVYDEGVRSGIRANEDGLREYADALLTALRPAPTPGDSNKRSAFDTLPDDYETGDY